MYYRKRGSASYIVREVLSVRERDTDRERERQRRKWRHHCRAKIGDEFTLSLAKIRTFARDGSDVLIVALKIKIGDEFIIAPFVSILPKFRAFRDEWSNIRVIEHSPLSVQFCKVLARTMHHRIYGVCKFWHAPCTMVRCLYQSIMYAKLTLARLHKNALRFLPAHWIAFSSLQFSLCWVTSAFMMSAEDDQKLRRRARNHRYRQGKGKEPQQQARIAASTAKYRRGKAKDPDHQARIAASNVKYRRGKAKEPEQQARIAASTAKYRRGKAKEPEPQARIAASTAKYRQGKFKEPDQQARTAASAAKYRAGQGRTEENKKKIKASQEAYMN